MVHVTPQMGATVPVAVTVTISADADVVLTQSNAATPRSPNLMAKITPLKILGYPIPHQAVSQSSFPASAPQISKTDTECSM